MERELSLEEKKDLLNVLEAMNDMDIVTLDDEGSIEELLARLETKREKLPQFHSELIERMKSGKYEVVDVIKQGKYGFEDEKGRFFFTPVKLIHYAKTLIYSFPFKLGRFAVPYNYPALSLRQRMAVLDLKDPRDFVDKIRKIIDEETKNQDKLPLIEGYPNESYAISTFTFMLKDVERFLDTYSTRVIKLKSDRELYPISLQLSDHTRLYRTYPDLYFFPTGLLGFLSFTVVQDAPLLVASLLSWPRMLAYHQILSKNTWERLVEGKNVLIHYPENRKDEEIESDFRPVSLPRPITYTQLAHFYNKDLPDYELEGQPLAKWKEEGDPIYTEAIKTFAYIEWQLKEWKAISFPSEIILRKYL
ncbi:MAG: hypothetical protein GXO39_09195 [Thermotogae bacterium]|nr:hypothetical protein [Thermotogota bacterium]